ncbi:MAG: hypothetical protein VW405_11065, partial [Rhodospirillaceae bacterium]
MENLLAVARARLDDGRADIAEALCAELAADRPEDAAVLATWGRALLCREGPAPRAVEALRRAHDLAPETPGVAADLGIAWLRQGDAAAAAPLFDGPAGETWRLAVEAVAGGAPPWDTMTSDALLLAARGLIVADRAAAARMALDVLAARGIDGPETMASRARVFAASGELAVALDASCRMLRGVWNDVPFRRRMYGTEAEMLARALSGALPDDPARLTLLALAGLDSAAGFAEGLAAVNRVLGRGSDRADAYLAGGLACLKQGDFAEVARLLAEARRLDPANERPAALAALA